MYTNKRLDYRFSTCMAIALIIHLALVASVTISPDEPLPPTSAITLTVKLGSTLSEDLGKALEVAPAPLAPEDAREEQVDEAQTLLSENEQGKAGGKELVSKVAEKKRPKQAAKSTIAAQKKSKGQVAKTYTREKTKQAPAAKTSGDVLGNKEQAAQHHATRYTQQLSLWIDKFKVYPDQAQRSGMEGVAHVRLRIDRRGNIRYHLLTHRTPYPILDKAAMDAVRRANPVPPVPDSYPDHGEFLEFIIPLRFRLK